MTIEKLDGVFKFSDSIEKERCDNFANLFSFLARFMEIHKRENAKLPYHINLIDKLHANENAHSRILAELLQQKADNRKYEILTSFVEYLKNKGTKENKKSFAAITIENPHITQETQRIDIRIMDSSYAVIIENKIHWASDQNKQLERYIDSTKQYSKKEEKQIFVIYLTPTYEKEPDQESWGKYFNSDIHTNRYLKLSFRDDILPWLKTNVLPTIGKKDVYLQSALCQYIDHLEGMFSLRTTNNKMNMELQKFIKQKLGIQEDSEPDKALEILAEKKEELENAIMQIGLLETQIRKNCFQKWEKWLKKDFPNYEIVSTWNNPKEYYPQVGLKLSIKGKETIAAIECENNDCYYGCFPHKATNTTKHPKIQNELEKLYPDVDWESNDSWYIYKHTSLQDVYGCLKTLIEEIIEKMG